eukprot:CAMPEP_0182568692 /NCGR_PEP_ID=MMETSP1324-20130603/9549_1 /TAXON_ID=236786 /ORGANISM="Florenciella sp., Strain RCC1587" /LENGTH=38 /DNA_ID= /DNA_START= /DNA_END= /DNA_ORIENTATION=
MVHSATSHEPTVMADAAANVAIAIHLETTIPPTKRNVP